MVEDVIDLYLVRQCTIKAQKEEHSRRLCNPRDCFSLISNRLRLAFPKKSNLFVSSRVHKSATGHNHVL